MGDPVTTGIMVAGAGISAYGQYSAGQAAAGQARYQGEVAAQNAQYQQALNDINADYQEAQLKANRERDRINAQVTKLQANFTYDAAQAEHEAAESAIRETLNLQLNELTRQQEQLVVNAQDTIDQANDQAEDDISDRLRQAHKELGTLRALGGEVGASQNVMRAMQELSYFKGVDVGRIEANREATVRKIETETRGQVASLQSSKVAAEAAARGQIQKSKLTVAMTKVGAEATNQATDATTTLNDYNAKAEQALIDSKRTWGKITSEQTAQVARDSGAYKGRVAAQQGAVGAVGSIAKGGLQIKQQ